MRDLGKSKILTESGQANESPSRQSAKEIQPRLRRAVTLTALRWGGASTATRFD